MLVATAHGTVLSDVLRNPDLSRLAGGVAAVTLGDAAASAATGGAKTRAERAGPPVFQVLVELQGAARWRVHLSVAASVDKLLAGGAADAHVRSWSLASATAAPAAAAAAVGAAAAGGEGGILVEFETTEAARRAAAMASELSAAAGGGGGSNRDGGDAAGVVAAAEGRGQFEGGWLVRLLQQASACAAGDAVVGVSSFKTS
jgi:hypothetical protein